MRSPAAPKITMTPGPVTFADITVNSQVQATASKPHPALSTWTSSIFHLPCHPPAGRSTWPPNLCRMAERTFSANVCSCRERNRAYNDEESTSAGTASSIAVRMVQRPSPESCTKPV